jgi:predicted permease
MMRIQVAIRVHRAMIRLLPRHVRRAYRTDIEQTFAAAAVDAASRRSTGGLVLLLFRELGDVIGARRANRPAPLFADADATGARRIARFQVDVSRWRQALRSLRRRPAYLVASLVTLAASTAVLTAVFALVDTVLLRPLPYPDADRLVTVYESSPSSQDRTSLVAPARLEDWQQRTRTFAALSGSYGESVTDTSSDAPERLEARRVAPRYFTVFAAAPALGRTFLPDEEIAGGSGVAVISDGYWARRFARSPAAIGHALLIGGRAFEIVGVMPPAFAVPRIDVWLPAQTPPYIMGLREARFLGGIGRLRPGIDLDTARRELAAIQAALAREFPKTDEGWSVEIGSLTDARVGAARQSLLLVFGAVAALWLIALANIAGLTLAQLRRRTQELGVRLALGASRPGVVAGLAREGVALALAGAAAGILLAAWLVARMPQVFDRMPRIHELSLDWRAVAFGATAAVAAACAFTIVPAIAATRRRIGGTLSGSSGRVAGGRHTLQRTMVAVQVALSVLLVGSAALLVQTYVRLSGVDPGFDPAGVIAFNVSARWDEDRARVGQLQQALLERLEALPYVEAAGFTNFLPATSATLRYQALVDGVSGSNADGSITVGARMIAGRYFAALRAPLISGEFCAPLRTGANVARTAIVNKQFADVHAPGQQLVGRTLRITQNPGSPLTIVGVVGDIVEDGPATRPVPYVYTCDPAGSWPDPEYVVRTNDARAYAVDLRRIARELDPARAVFGLRPVQEVLDGSLSQPRLDASVVGLFAAAALALAAIGLYGLFMLIVADSARALAVRAALGAAPRQITRLVLVGAARLLAVGLVCGALLTVLADRLLRSVMADVRPLDPLAIGVAVVVLAFVSLLAVLLPARRAARIDPLAALRAE